MMACPPFGKPLGFRFNRAFRNSVLSKWIKEQDFFICGKNNGWFASPGRLKKSDFRSKSEISHPWPYTHVTVTCLVAGDLTKFFNITWESCSQGITLRGFDFLILKYQVINDKRDGREKLNSLPLKMSTWYNYLPLEAAFGSLRVVQSLISDVLRIFIAETKKL